MQIAVISDLHLGLGDATDSFGHRDVDFLRFLRQLEREFDRIVLLGDIWETLTTHRLFDAAEGLKRARESHPEVARRLLGSKYLYVHGNHDWIAGTIDGAPSEWLLDVDGLRLIFTHGHHHDWLLRRARWLSEWCVWLGAWTRRLGCDVLYRIGYYLDAQMCKPAACPTVDSFQSWAFALAGHRSADVVITGHTHVAASAENAGRLYMNSGSCAESNFSYLAIDTRANRFDVCQALAGS